MVHILILFSVPMSLLQRVLVWSLYPQSLILLYPLALLHIFIVLIATNVLLTTCAFVRAAFPKRI